MGRVKSLLLDYEHLDNNHAIKKVEMFLSTRVKSTCTSNKCCVTSKQKEARKRKKRCH